MKPLSDDELDLIRRRVARAIRRGAIHVGEPHTELSRSDWVLAGHAFEDVPRLLATVEELQSRLTLELLRNAALTQQLAEMKESLS